MTMTETFAADAANAAATAARYPALPSEIRSLRDQPDEHREHVLVWGIPAIDDAHVEHHDGSRAHEAQQCADVEHALHAFVDHLSFSLEEWTAYEQTPPIAPGRYLCSVGPDGNFEIGSRVS